MTLRLGESAEVVTVPDVLGDEDAAHPASELALDSVARAEGALNPVQQVGHAEPREAGVWLQRYDRQHYGDRMPGPWCERAAGGNDTRGAFAVSVQGATLTPSTHVQ